MDRNVLKARMRERFEAAMEAALKAVEEAPDGQGIAGSEWQVRDAFQALTADCYRETAQSNETAEKNAGKCQLKVRGFPSLVLLHYYPA